MNKKYMVEWSCVDLVYPSLTPDPEVPWRITNKPDYTNCGGFLKVEALSEAHVWRAMQKVMPRASLTITQLV